MTTTVTVKTWDQVVDEAGGKRALQQRLLELAERTQHVRSFHTGSIFGPAQTREYAMGMMGLSNTQGSQEDLEAAVTLRMARGDLIGRADHTFHVLLRQGALRTPYGGTAAMPAQLARLEEFMGREGFTLGIIPDRAEPQVAPGTSFTLFDDEILDIEAHEVNVTADAALVARHATVHEKLARSAVYGADALALIHDELAELAALS